MVAALEAQGAITTQGVTSGRPAASASQPRRFYFATDTNILWYDNGGTWVQVAPIGGATPTTSYPGTAGSEGTSPSAARLDHTHPHQPVTWQTSDVVTQSLGAGGGTRTIAPAITVTAVPYPRLLEARLRAMTTAQSGLVQFHIWTPAPVDVAIRSGSATAANQSVEVTFREVLAANTARIMSAVMISTGSVNLPAQGAYCEFNVSTRVAGAP